MKSRQNRGCRPQITFTSDFHELVQGDLVPGPSVLRYDPLRLIPVAEINGDKHEIHAHIRFHPSAQMWEGKLVVPAHTPLAALSNPAGQGFMLETSFDLPPGTDELETWFSCTHADGETHWDSHDGKNYWLRFSLYDIKDVQATVCKPEVKNPAQSSLTFDIVSLPQVHQIVVRWRLPAFQERPRVDAVLVRSVASDGDIHWTTDPDGIQVPIDTAVVFDLVYFIGDRKFTDDNYGRYYLADE